MTEKKIILIFGKRGSGKSFLAIKRAENSSRLVIFDTLGEYKNGVIFDNAAALAKFWDKHYQSKFRLIYRPLNPEAEIDQIANLVWLCGNCTFLIEEVDCFCSAYSISNSLAQIIQRGRHKEIELIGVTQRPFGIHRLLTSQAKEICVFNSNEPRDREYFKALLGVDIESKLDTLKQYEYVKWTDQNDCLEVCKE